jgi:hypothetical protein
VWKLSRSGRGETFYTHEAHGLMEATTGVEQE